MCRKMEICGASASVCFMYLLCLMHCYDLLPQPPSLLWQMYTVFVALKLVFECDNIAGGMNDDNDVDC